MGRFRLPGEIKKKEKRLPVSTRLRESQIKELERLSRKAGVTLAELIENALQDYLSYVGTRNK